MCIVCNDCFQRKLSWQNEPNVCMFCNKKTAKKFMDLSLPENTNHVTTYFGNAEASLMSSLKVFEFQMEVSKKYCKHLEAKIKKY
jgi:hypothetical protein